jgi:predicted nucleic acid-binding protein
MFQLLIDTCVWLDIAKDRKQQTLLTALERLLEHKKIELIVPRIVIDEFNRNKERIVQDATHSMSSTLRRAKELVGEFGKGAKARKVIEEIENIDFLVPSLGDSAVDTVVRIEKLFGAAKILEIADAFKLRAAQRAFDKKAPFHREKNSMADAVLLEMYGEIAASTRAHGFRFAFVTHNIKDFSQVNGDTRIPHPDIAPHFSKIRSLYSTNLGELLKRIDSELLAELKFDEEFTFEPRSASEILSESEDLAQIIWYDRHQLWRQRIEEGKHRIVPDAEWKSSEARETTKQSIWEGAKKAAAKVEKTYGKENLGPWTKFEWGMLNGKLSALLGVWATSGTCSIRDFGEESGSELGETGRYESARMSGLRAFIVDSKPSPRTRLSIIRGSFC